MRLLSLVVSLVLVGSVFGQTVQQDTVLLSSNGTPGPPLGQYVIAVFQDLANEDSTGIGFDRSGNNLIYRATALDEGSDWYFASANQVFNASSAALGEFVSFGTVDQSYSIPTGNFYMAFATGLGFVEDSPVRNVFGWVLLRNSGGTISLLGSATAYGSNGIEVGTANAIAIPEPSAYVGIVASIAAIAVLVRRRRQER